MARGRRAADVGVLEGIGPFLSLRGWDSSLLVLVFVMEVIRSAVTVHERNSIRHQAYGNYGRDVFCTYVAARQFSGERHVSSVKRMTASL